MLWPVPELLEVETYRKAIDAVRGTTITSVRAPDPIVRNGPSEAVVVDSLVGRRISKVSRHGKLLLIDDQAESFLGLHFGMTGELVVDGKAAIDGLVYSSRRRDPTWCRFSFTTTKGHVVEFYDPRRLGRVTLLPTTDHLGPDAAAVSMQQLTVALDTKRAVKAALLDQHRIAGLGNLLTDEALWRAGIDPHRESTQLNGDDRARLLRAIKQTIRVLGSRGGSHMGDIFDVRVAGGTCPRCGHAMRSATVGSRTTWWCPTCQK
jgi:formamidopyrimidine-DNA glycosylase